MEHKIITRLFQYIDYKKIPHTRFEKELGFSNGYLNTQLKRNADLGESIIRRVVDNCLDLDEVWFLTGKGDMLKGNNKNTITQSIKGNNNNMAGENSTIRIDGKDISNDNLKELHTLLNEYKARIQTQESYIKDLLEEQKSLHNQISILINKLK
jgi:hypothetical protein